MPSTPHLLDVTMLWGPMSGGVRRYVMAKRAWLRQQGLWRHTVVAPTVQGPDMVAASGLPLPGSGGYRLPLSRRDHARLLVQQAPDVIEAGDIYRLAWSAVDAARQLHIPLVGFCHSNVDAMARRAGGRVAGWAARQYARRLYEHCDLVLAPSRHMVDQMRDWGVEGVVHQPLGVDTDVFHPSRADPRWRAHLGLGAEDRVLLYAGRFGPEKNLDVLARAVRRLGRPYVLVALGGGPCPPKGEQVRVLPFVNDSMQLARCVASADAFVHAGDQETFGLALLEAMACGRPVVARACAGLAELMDAQVGESVHRNDPEAYAQAIDALFERDPVACSQAARSRALGHDWQVVLPALFARYQRLLETPCSSRSSERLSTSARP